MPIKITNTAGPSPSLAEIYQSMRTTQALLRKITDCEYERITPFVLCRDFLVDAYTFSKAKKDFQIYGFSFKGATEQPDTTGIYLLLKFDQAATRAAFNQHLPILQELEQNNHIPLTETHIISETENLVVGDKTWLKSCLTLSLYTFLLRAMCYEFAGYGPQQSWDQVFAKLKTSDARYVASVHPSIWQKLMTDISFLYTDHFCGFDPAVDSVSTIHHNSGFFSVFGSHTEINPRAVKQNKHWQQMQQKGLPTALK